MGSVPFDGGLLPVLSLPEFEAFLEAAAALDLDDVERVGTGLSFAFEL